MVFPLFFYIIHLYPNLGLLPNLYCWTREAQAQGGFWEFFLFWESFITFILPEAQWSSQPSLVASSFGLSLFQLGDEGHWHPRPLHSPLMVDLIPYLCHCNWSWWLPTSLARALLSSKVELTVMKDTVLQVFLWTGRPSGQFPWWCSREPPSFSTGRPCHEQLPPAEHSPSPPRWWQCWPCLKDRWPHISGQFAGSFLLLLGQQPLLCLCFISGLYLWVSLSRWVAVCGSRPGWIG